MKKKLLLLLIILFMGITVATYYYFAEPNAKSKFEKVKLLFEQKERPSKVEVRAILGESDNEKQAGKLLDKFELIETWSIGNERIIYEDWGEKVTINLWEVIADKPINNNAPEPRNK